jgi:predicted ATP-grasp superfamily ATP-dependent carboligase
LDGARVIGPDRVQYDRLCDKAGLEETAAAVGASTPASVFVDSDGPSGEWPSLPNIVKPRASATPTAGGVVFEMATLVRTVAERDASVTRLVAATGGALVQEQVVGPAYRGHFVRTAGGLHFLTVSTVRRYPPETGMSSVSLTVPVHRKLEAVTHALVEEVGYRGPGSVQAIERDGELFVHDVNLRPEYALGVSIAAGFDIPRLAVDDALGRARDGESVRPREGQRYVWFSGELRRLASALRRRSREDPPGQIAAELILAALSPRRVLDPFDLTDPLPLLATIAAGLGRIRRRP